MNAKELRTKDAEELKRMLQDERKGLGNLRFRSAASEIENSAQIRRTRRTIARILTLLRERETAQGAPRKGE